MKVKFGKLDNNNFEDFYSANFLQYSNDLRVVRVQNTSVANATESGSSLVIKNTGDYQDNYVDGSFCRSMGGTEPLERGGTT